jgi:hypothetical protein
MSAQDALLIGPARLYVAAVGTAVDNTDIVSFTPTSAPSGWTYLGDTTEAVTVKDAPSYAKATSQQSDRVLEITVTEIATTISTTLREIDAARLATFLRSTASAGVINATGIGPVPKFAVALVGPWPGGQALFTAERCAYTGEHSVSWNASEYSTTAVEIEVLTNAGATPYTIYLAD